MRITSLLPWACTVAISVALAGCGSTDPNDEPIPGEGAELTDDDLSVGDLSAEDSKADGNWGAATTCKPIPNVPKLKAPRIIVSLEGLTLHLIDPDSGYDKVFPIGPGAIEESSSSIAYGESKSMWPVLRYGTGDFQITPGTTTACKIWWTDASTGTKSPVFAGLPFMSWSGNYAIHGPVDNYRAANGGNLRRGYVSHGCVRMAAEDVLEVYARIRGIAKVPVHVQREAERDAQGRRVDVPLEDRWLGAECETDADCPWQNGFCDQNRYSDRGYCSARCSGYCPDKAGESVSFCVPDPDASGTGVCVLKESAVNSRCRNLDHFAPKTSQRLNQSSVTANVCLPGTRGWIGDHCLTNADCTGGTTCAGVTEDRPGFCTQPCTAGCPDQAGWPTTFCANEPSLGGNVCVRQCTLSTNASECVSGTVCEPRTRPSSTVTKNVCVPE